MKVIGITTGILLTTLAATNALANSFSNELSYYCSSKNVEFQQSIKVGSGTRVYINQGSQSYTTSKFAVEPPYGFIEEQLVVAGGVSQECAEFLMTKGDQAYSADGIIARVHFAFDSSELTKQSRYILDTLLERLQYSNKVTVEGHTDSVGEKKYNFTLGAKRAVAVADYMDQHPNTPYNLIKVSKGETDPVADNNTEEGRYLNRRVDIK